MFKSMKKNSCPLILYTLVEIVPSWFLSNMSKAALKAASSSGLSLSAMMLSALYDLPPRRLVSASISCKEQKIVLNLRVGVLWHLPRIFQHYYYIKHFMHILKDKIQKKGEIFIFGHCTVFLKGENQRSMKNHVRR